jgi:carbon storage regulator
VLVLARAEGQTVVLDDRIVVTVLDSRDGLVRLGIEAPRDVGVRRGELAPISGDGGRPSAPPAPSVTG